jgi:hypothetical protein
MAGTNYLEIRSPYGYTPSLAPSLAYLIVFALLTLLHIGMGIKYKYWIVFVTLVPGGICAYLIRRSLSLCLAQEYPFGCADDSGGCRLGRTALVALPSSQFQPLHHANMHVSTSAYIFPPPAVTPVLRLSTTLLDHKLTTGLSSVRRFSPPGHIQSWVTVSSSSVRHIHCSSRSCTS